MLGKNVLFESFPHYRDHPVVDESTDGVFHHDFVFAQF
jgi:hypothetical protein